MLYDAFSRPVKRVYAEPEEVKGVSDVSNFGAVIDEHALKKGLVELNPSIHFDLGARINKYHPRIDEWQSIFYNGEHLASMDRDVIPEYNVYGLNKQGQRVKVMRIGWRSTLENIHRHNLPNLTWDHFCVKFGVDKKNFRGHSMELKVAS